MSFRKNESQQINLSDNYMNQSERTKRYLDKSWASGFSDIIFPMIDESRFEVLYSEQQFSRPNTPVNIIIGALILKELNNLTDDELLESVLFDIRYQYALRTTSFEEQPVSDRTVSRFRRRLREYEEETGIDLLKAEMESLAGAFAEYMGMGLGLKRMDSLMVASNCKQMSRLELFYACVSNLVKAACKAGAAGAEEGFGRYLTDGDKNNTIYRSKPDEASGKLEELLRDALLLLDLLSAEFAGTEEYGTLSRLLDEQTEKAEDGAELKTGKDISAASLQNPSDQDATFRKKAGGKHTGYVGNIVETVDAETGTGIITSYDYQPNIYHDSQFCKDVIQDHEKQEETVTLVADGAYYSVENIEKAAEKNIELVTTAMTGIAPSKVHKDFVKGEGTKAIVKCPAGFEPEHCWHNEKRDDYRLTFEKPQCEACPNKLECKPVVQEKNAVVKISSNMITRSEYLDKMESEEYKELGKFRNGVEGVPSVLRRRYRVDEIPVFGLLCSKIWFSFKIGAINVKRLLAWEKTTTQTS
jgi:hypothetical protein